MGVQEILNFIQVDEETATGGQPSADQFCDARNAGYDLVINLAPDGLETSLSDEAALLRSMKVEYHHIPVEWTNPTLDELDEFIAVMDKSAGRRKLIHCQANFRVTAFYALYAMARLGWKRQQADALVERVWTTIPGFEMDDTWKTFMHEAAQRIASSR